jgi:hypothetical protein
MALNNELEKTVEMGVVSLKIGSVCRGRGKPGQFSVKASRTFILGNESFSHFSFVTEDSCVLFFSLQR